MGFAWNIGNTMEVPGDPTAWGNPLPSQQLIEAVKAGGFKTIRIPCAWDSHADQTSMVIAPEWFETVKTVVDHCINAGLYVVLNSHWDGGWLEEHVFPANQAEVNNKQQTYWTQIATFFRDYDHHLLFAGANEPAVQDAYDTEFGADRMNVLLSYLQTFIDAVRATGGNNASRTLIIQGPRTNIELTNDVMTTLPTDNIADRMMAELHFYPYQFALMEEDADWGKVFYYWGNGNHSTTDTERNPTWGEESYVDSMFNIVKAQFVDNDIPVIIGEFGSMKRTNLTGESLALHIKSRRAYYQYVVSSAMARGIIPIAWDTGFKGLNTMTIFDRNGDIYDLGLLNAIRFGGGLPKLPGDTSLVQIATGDNAMKILYSAKDSTWGQVELNVLQGDMSDIASVTIRAYVNGETNYDSAGTQKYGYISMSLVTMSDEWTWKEASLGDVAMNKWAEYTIPVSTDPNNDTALVPANPSKIDFIALQMYSTGYRGTIYIDWITFQSNSGTVDTVYSFNLTSPESGAGNVESVKLILTDDVESDTEWLTATTPYPGSSKIIRNITAFEKPIRARLVGGNVVALLETASAGSAQLILSDLRGKVLATETSAVHPGKNTLHISAPNHDGVMLLQVRKGSEKYVLKVIKHR